MTYEYMCTACGHGWEAEQSISAAPLTECPSCHAASAKRQVSGGAGFILKGGGWYNDLYASAPKKSADAPAGSTESSAGEKKDAGSADAAKPKTDTSSGSGTAAGSGGAGSSTPGGGKSSGASAA